jgi:hypothetical protein
MSQETVDAIFPLCLTIALIIGALGGLWVRTIFSAREKEKEREEQRKLRERQEDYERKLRALAKETTKANRIAALESGRALARYCREQRKVAIFDEVKLQNDLQAYGAEEH